MSVDASKRTMLWISDSCNGHPCRAIVFVSLIEIRSLPPKLPYEALSNGHENSSRLIVPVRGMVAFAVSVGR